MSTRELERVEVIGRVGNGGLKLRDAAAMLQLSYRPGQTLVATLPAGGQQGAAAWKCWSSLQSQQARQISAPSPELIKQKYSGSEEERFGPTLAAELLPENVDGQRLRLALIKEKELRR